MARGGSDRIVRIGGASAYFADSALAVPQLLGAGGLDYLVFDYLAEGSMAIFGRMQQADPATGYSPDLLTVHVGPHLREIAAQGIKVVANAGGVNTEALAEKLRAMIAEAGLRLRVATVEGDDMRPQADALRAEGVCDMFTGEPFPERVVSANAYLGGFPIAEALARGADIVLTGRIVDSAIVLGPLIHEFGWGPDDHDLLAAGTLAGHLLECSTQITGGTFTDWRDVPGWEDMGYPIGECSADGSIVITKPEGTGGLVSIGTVAEQLLYEVSDPADYIVTDVSCDFSQVVLTQEGDNRVRASGAKGRPPTPFYKVCVTHDRGWRANILQPIVGEEARAKAERQAEALIARGRMLLRSRNLPDFTATATAIIGGDSSFGPHDAVESPREVVLRITADHDDPAVLGLFAREQSVGIISMSVGTTLNLATTVLPLTGVWLCLIPRTRVPATVTLDGESWQVPATPGVATTPAVHAVSDAADPPGDTPVDLIRLAWGRSGDKGALFNVAVIARRPEYLPYLRDALTTEAVSDWFAHLSDDGGPPPVERYEAPGLNALNFVVRGAMDGGIIVSSRLDPAAKGMAQMMMRMPVPVPAALSRTLGPEARR